MTDRTTIVFKGNFAVGGVGKTGVFYWPGAGTQPDEFITTLLTAGTHL